MLWEYQESCFVLVYNTQNLATYNTMHQWSLCLYCKAAKCVSKTYSYTYTLQHVYEYMSWQQGWTDAWALALLLPLVASQHFFGSWQLVLSQEHQRHSLGNKVAHDPSKHDQPVLRSSCGIWPQKQSMSSGFFYLTRWCFSTSFTDAHVGLVFFMPWRIFQLS